LQHFAKPPSSRKPTSLLSIIGFRETNAMVLRLLLQALTLGLRSWSFSAAVASRRCQR
jgi:hypothetical protein